MRRFSIACLAGGLTLILCTNDVLIAQEAIQTTAATQPSVGHFIPRWQVRYYRFDRGESRIKIAGWDVHTHAFLAYGLTSNLAGQVEIPLVHRQVTDGESSTGLADPRLSAKWRFWQDDFGPVNTARWSAWGGLEIPSGDNSFSTDSLDPFFGTVFTLIDGRHGLNQSLQWKFSNGSTPQPIFSGQSRADEGQAHTSYLYRIAPMSYTEDFQASWYGVLEMSWFYETNGDWSAHLAPGLLYEHPDWAMEASVQLPIDQEVKDRPENELSIIVGIRLLF